MTRNVIYIPNQQRGVLYILFFFYVIKYTSAAPIGSQRDMEVVTIYNQNEGRVRDYNIERIIIAKVNRCYAMCGYSGKLISPFCFHSLQYYIIAILYL